MTICSTWPVTVTNAVNTSVGSSAAPTSSPTCRDRPATISAPTRNRPRAAAMGAAWSLVKGTAPSSSAAAHRLPRVDWSD